MKVVFVNNDIGYDTCLNNISINKIYEVNHIERTFSVELGQSFTLYNIVLDNGRVGNRNSKLFITLDEFRNKQIEKIL